MNETTETTQTAEQTTSAPAAESQQTQPQSTPQATGSGVPSVGGSPEQSVQVQPTWTPNFKYTVKGVEKEIDPLFRDIIKDASSEEKVRRMFEQVDGVDLLKQKHQDVETRFKDIETKFNDQTQKLQYAAQLWEQDKDQFFEFMGMDVKDIYKWVAEKLRLEEAPESEKQLYTREQEARRLAMEREHQLKFYEQKAAQEAANAKSFQLQQVLTKPEVSSIAGLYDSKYGKGAFETAVKQLGKNVWDTQGIDLSAEEAVQQMVNFFSPLLTPAQTNQPVAPAKETPAIPVIKSGSASPAKRAVKSIADIKKLAAQM